MIRTTLCFCAIAAVVASCGSLWPIAGATAGGALGSLGGPVGAGMGAGAGAAAGEVIAQDGRIDDANARASTSEGRILEVVKSMVENSSDEVKTAAVKIAMESAESAAKDKTKGFVDWFVGMVKVVGGGIAAVVVLVLAYLFLTRGKKLESLVGKVADRLGSEGGKA